MPIYEFKCNKCTNKFQKLVTGFNINSLECPKCKSKKTSRIISAVAVLDSHRGNVENPSGASCSSCSSSNCSTCG